LRKSARQEARQHFFNTIDTIEINKQLDPSLLDHTWGILHEEVSKPAPFPTACARTQYIFCFGNSGEPYEIQLRNYATTYKAKNHVELHLKHYKLNDQIPCPDPGCQKAAIVLDGQLHFMSHAARQHSYNIFRKPKY